MKGIGSVKMNGETAPDKKIEVDIREIYFLIMHFLSAGPCRRATGQLWNELLQHKLLPRRYHPWYSRQGKPSGDEDDDGYSLPLSYSQVAERYPHIETDHLVKLLEQLLLNAKANGPALGGNLTAADVPTLLGTGPFSLLDFNRSEPKANLFHTRQLRWPYLKADLFCGLLFRELGGGFTQHHISPAMKAANCALAKPAVLVDRIQIVKKFRGHCNAVYCAIFDRSGELVITGSDDRLVKLWSTKSGFCLHSCRGHEGDITDLAVSSNNKLVASASNDCTICVENSMTSLRTTVKRKVVDDLFESSQCVQHKLLIVPKGRLCRPKRIAANSARYPSSHIVGHGQEDDNRNGTLIAEKYVYDSCGLKDKGAVETARQDISDLSEFSRHPRSYRDLLMNIEGYEHRMAENNGSPSHQKSVVPEKVRQVSGHKVLPIHSIVPKKRTKKILHSKEMKRFDFAYIGENRRSFSVESRCGNLNQSLQGTENHQEKSNSCKGGIKGRSSDPTIIDFCNSDSDASSANDQSAKVFQRQKQTLFEHKSIEIPESDIYDLRVKGKIPEPSSTRGDMVCNQDSFAYSQILEDGKFAEKTYHFKRGIVEMKSKVKLGEGFNHEFKCQELLPEASYNSRFQDNFNKPIMKKFGNSSRTLVCDVSESKIQFPRQMFDMEQRSNPEKSQYVVSKVPSGWVLSDASNSKIDLDNRNLQVIKKGSKGVRVFRKQKQQEFSNFSHLLEEREQDFDDFMMNESLMQNLPACQLAEGMEDIFNKCSTGREMEEMQGTKHSMPSSDNEVEPAVSQSIDFINSSPFFGKSHELLRSWSSSEQESAKSSKEAHINSRCKKRTLGELQSSLRHQHTYSLHQDSHNDGSTSKRKVRYVRSLMSQYGKKTKTRKNKGRKVAINKGNDLQGKHKGKKRLERNYCDVNLAQRKPRRYKRSYEAQSSEREEEREVINFDSQRRVAFLDRLNDEVGTAQGRKGIWQSERVKRDISKNIWGMTQENQPVTKALSGGLRKGISWLMLTEVEEGGRYIPQLGDEVAYLRQGHEEFLELRKLNEKGPWKIFKSCVQAVEFCQIIDLDYVIESPFGDTSCLLTLQFSDDNSDLYDNTFQLNLPELINFPDFLVERTQYDASIARNWTNRDKCKIWWQAEDGNGGNWWEARVIAVKSKSQKFPDSPWERIVVHYKADTSGPHTHSPWELVDRHCRRWEAPCMDGVIKTHFLTCFQKLECTNMPEDKYGMRDLQHLSSRSDFVNWTPLPLTLDIIKLRIIKDYYRSPQAFKHDLRVLVSNVRNYLGSENEITKKVEYLAAEITDNIFPPELFDFGSQTDGANETFK